MRNRKSGREYVGWESKPKREGRFEMKKEGRWKREKGRKI